MGTDLLLSEKEIREAADLLGEILVSYQAGVADERVLPEVDRAAIHRLLEEPFPEEPRSVKALFDEFREVILPNSTHVSHPRFLAYILSSPHGLAPFAEALAAALNQSSSLWTISPVASAIEQKLVSWFSELFHFPEKTAGLITSGGSMANLMALTVARDHRLGERAREDGIQAAEHPLTAYTSDQAHNSVDKAIGILGLGLKHLRHIPTDDDFRIRLEPLIAAIEKDKTEGRTPFCVIATAGTVTSGAIDPLDELADLCERENLWLHIDGAYGAFAILNDRLRPQLAAAGRGNSMTLDPHKLLFNSVEAGCLLVRDRNSMRRTYSFVPDYLSISSDPDLINFTEYGPQLSRSFKALKVWWGLRAFGRKAYVRTIERLLDLAAYMATRILQEPRLELLAPAPLTAVCFRHRHLDDAGNQRLLDAVVRSGVAFLGPARLKGRTGVRACFTNLRTSRADVDTILDEFLRLAESQDHGTSNTG